MRKVLGSILLFSFVLVFVLGVCAFGATVAFVRQHAGDLVGKRVELFGSVISLGGRAVLVDATDCICLKGVKGGIKGYFGLSGEVRLSGGTPYVKVVEYMKAIRGDQLVKKVSLKVGEQFEVLLDELATAGYTWHVTKIDKSCVRLVSKRSKRITPKGVLGGKNLRVFVFETLKKGKSLLVLKEYRVWEGEKKSVKSFTLFLDVE